MFVDDIYDISSNDFTVTRFTIQPFKPSLRNELITNVYENQTLYRDLNTNDKLRKLMRIQILLISVWV